MLFCTCGFIIDASIASHQEIF